MPLNYCRYIFAHLTNQLKMKHLKSIITLIVITFTLASCSTDDDGGSNNVSEENLIGTWSLTATSQESSFSGSAQGNEVDATITSTGSNFDFTVVFNNDNTVSANGTYDETITSDINGTISTETQTITTNDEQAEWTLDGDQLTFEGEQLIAAGDLQIIQADIEPSFTIETLNETTLELRFNEEQNLGVDGLSYTINVVQTYARVN